MRVPDHLDKLTVEQFINCNELNNNTSLDPLDRNILLLAEVTSESVSYIESLPTAKLKIYLSQVGYLFKTELSKKPKRFIMIGWRVYQAIQLASELRDLMSTNQFTTYSELTKQDPIKNMHLVLPLMYCRYSLFRKPSVADNQTSLQEMFKRAKMGDISGTAFFFETQLQAFMPVLQNLHSQAMKTVEDHMKEVLESGNYSMNNTAGITQL